MSHDERCTVCGAEGVHEDDAEEGQTALHFAGESPTQPILLCPDHRGAEFCDFCGKQGEKGELLVWGDDIGSPSSPVCVHDAGESTGYVCEECAEKEDMQSYECDKCERQVVYLG